MLLSEIRIKIHVANFLDIALADKASHQLNDSDLEYQLNCYVREALRAMNIDYTKVSVQFAED